MPRQVIDWWRDVSWEFQYSNVAFFGGGLLGRKYAIVVSAGLIPDSLHFFDRIVLPRRPNTIVLYGGQ